ncbi:hypothetical protein FRC06_010967 [Ceratobasidium sp. 370]|nr:hypothetical protein FRC06_010967 [Ceratobasidium sp. 370]
MPVEFELPVLHISMAAVDKMQGPDALQALWTVFTKTTGALEDGPRLENLTWRLWHRQLLNDGVMMQRDVPVTTAKEPTVVEVVEVVSDDSDSNDDWEDDSAPPSRDPVQPPAITSTRRQSSTTALHPPACEAASRPARRASDLVLSASQPTVSARPAFTNESRTNSAPEAPHAQHGSSQSTNIGRIISHLLPEKLDVLPPSWALAQPSAPVTAQDDHAPSTPRTQPVQFLIHSPSTPPNTSNDYLAAHLPPTLMVINPTPRPTPPDTPATHTRAVPTNIPVALSPGVTPPALAPPSALSQPHSVLMPCPSASDKLVSAAALPLTPTLVGPPELTDEDSKKKIFYVQSPEEFVEDVEEPETANKQTSASTSHTITSVPVAPAPLSMTPAANPPPAWSGTPVVTRTVSNPRASRASVRSPPNMLAPATPAAPFTTIAPVTPPAPTQNAPTEAPRPPPSNNSSALLGLGRRAVHVETSSDLESDSEELWSDDESDSEDPLARAANEAGRQRSMFEKIRPKPPPRIGRGLLTNLMNPDPDLYPQAIYRQHNSAQNLAAGRRGTPTILQTSRSTVAVPTATAITAEQITTHVTVDPKGRAVGGSGTRGLRLQGRPEGDVDDDGSTDEENSISNELSKSVAQRRLEALANRARAPPPPAMEQVRHGEPDSPALAPRPAPQHPPATIPYDMDIRPIHSPRTVRRKMIAGELSESLRRNLMWERTSTRFAMGGGALGSGLRPLTAARPGVVATNSDRGPDGTRSGDEDSSQQLNEARRLALARNKSWANDFHHAGW